MATSSLQHQVLWTIAKLVPEALKHRSSSGIDPALIQLLGREKFVEMVVFGVVGWQQGVSHLFPINGWPNFVFLAFSLQNPSYGLNLFIFAFGVNYAS